MATAVASSRAIPAGISDSAIEAQLARILASAEFDATPRERSFLKYVVGETVAGRSARIKAYSIAVEVFGRDGSFDAQRDPIVRIEAGHLRRSLERYYLTAGQADPLLISIPKGAYVPEFCALAPAAAGAAEAEADAPSAGPSRRRLQLVAAGLVVLGIAVALVVLAWPKAAPPSPEIPRLLVEPMTSLVGPSAEPAAVGLTQEIMAQLSKFRDLVVVEADPRQQDRLPRYVLNGSVGLSPEALRVNVRLINRDDGSVLWGNSYGSDLKVTDVLKAQADIANQVATALAQVYGVVFQAEASRAAETPPEDWSAYACTLHYYAYRANLDRQTHPRVRACLEDTVKRFPAYATAWALLSQIYVDEYRFRYAPDLNAEGASMDRALDAARKAVQLDPLNVRALQALMSALYFSGDRAAALKVGKQALAVNPNDTELMGEYGYRLAMSGEWPEGCALLAQARERNPGPLAYYEVALGLCGYYTGDVPSAVAWIERAAKPDNPNFHIVAAAIYAEAGLADAARAQAAWLVDNEPELVKRMRTELAARFPRRNDVDKFMGSLRKAGLDVGP